MEILFDPINFVLLIAAITLLWWLKSVLGQRTGFEKKGFDIEAPQAPQIKPIATLKPTKLIVDDWQAIAAPGSELAKGLDLIKTAYPEFNPTEFIEGAKKAHELILIAFSHGEKKTLKQLLNDSVFISFETAIKEAQKSGNTTSLKFVGVNTSKIVSAELEKGVAAIGVDFTSEVISVTKNRLGEIIDGDEKTVSTIRELWIFERDTKTNDPNWKLAATNETSSLATGEAR